jgi:hypothetical protein
MNERMDGVERSGEEDNDGVGLEKRRVEKEEVLRVSEYFWDHLPYRRQKEKRAMTL